MCLGSWGFSCLQAGELECLEMFKWRDDTLVCLGGKEVRA